MMALLLCNQSHFEVGFLIKKSTQKLKESEENNYGLLDSRNWWDRTKI